MAGNNQI